MVRLAPPGKLQRIVQFLSDPGALYEVFEAAAEGRSLSDYAARTGVSYFALMAIYESPLPVFEHMRSIVRKALATEDRTKAREAFRSIATFGGAMTEDESRFVNAGVKLADSEEPKATAAQSVKVGVHVNLGAALVDFHKKRQAVVIEQQPEPDDPYAAVGL